jgi:hypothetical protein
MGLCLLVAAAGGCLFDTRDPEPPDTGEQVRWENPEVKFLALGNMERALEAKELDNYERSFAAAVEMKLSDEDEQFYNSEEEFPAWSGRKEAERMQLILDGTDATLDVRWYFTPDQPDSVAESATVEYYKDLGYEMTFTQGSQSVVYSGLVDLWFEDDGQGFWYVTKWIDKKDDTANQTWGWLRAKQEVEF